MNRGVQSGGRRSIADGMPGAAHRQVMATRPSPWNLGGLSVRELARRVWNEIDDKGWEVRGIVHSHTHTEAYPSETDVRQAFLPDAWYVLVSLMDREQPMIRGFSIREGDVLEREVMIR